MDESNPMLKPKDLEDVADIFDRIRLMYKKKEDSLHPPPKKLIAKYTGKIDDLAVEFDKRLTDIMLRLSKSMQDPLITSSQKCAEIEKSKFLLLNYCNEKSIRFIKNNKGNLLMKDAKDIIYITSKVKEGMCRCFLNLGSLFYSKEEKEVTVNCEVEM